MPNGSAHYDAAARILDGLVDDDYDELDDRSEYQLRVASVHAQLATAGALAALIAEAKRGRDMHAAVPPLDERLPDPMKPQR